MQAIGELVAVWMANGRPCRIVWEGRRYWVNDVPTLIESEPWWHPAITHPPAVPVGWRFQAQAESGEVRVFDIRKTVQGWELIRSYD